MNTEEKIYRPTPWKSILYALICLAFTVGGTFMVEDKPMKGWFVTVCCGLGFLVFVIQIIPGSTELKLTSEGFETTSLFRKHLTRWEDVETFQIGTVGRNETIMFDYVESHNKHQTGKMLSKQLSGSHGALPTTYGLKASELLEILNQWKSRYGSGS